MPATKPSSSRRAGTRGAGDLFLSHSQLQEEASLCPGEVLAAWRPDLWCYRRWAELVIDSAGRSLRGQEWDRRSEGAAEL